MEVDVDLNLETSRSHTTVKTSLRSVLQQVLPMDFQGDMTELSRKMQRIRIRTTNFIHWYMLRHENPTSFQEDTIQAIMIFMNGLSSNQTTSNVNWRSELERLSEDLIQFNALTGTQTVEGMVDLYMEQLFPNATGTISLTIGYLQQEIKSTAMSYMNNGHFPGTTPSNPVIVRRRQLTVELVEQFYQSNPNLEKPIYQSTELFVYESRKIFTNLKTNIKVNFIKSLKKYFHTN